MGSRYGNRNYGEEGRDAEEFGRGRSGGRWGRRHFGESHYPSGGFGRARQNEEYFGGSRQMGEGNRPEYERDYDTYPRDYEPGYRSAPREATSRLTENRDFGDGYGMRDRPTRFGNERFGERYRRSGRGQHGAGIPSSERGFENIHDTGYDERDWWDRASDEVSSWFGDEEAARRRMMDERREGDFRGRGPRNYTRSDERIREDVNDRLTDYPYIDASEIEVEVSAGNVVLSGTVDSRYDKRIAEDIADDISGVKNVENRLRVVSGTFGEKNETTSETNTASRGKSA
jgi:osmotically-inducible protein OsmY